MATNSVYSHPGQTYSGLSKCDSRPVILAEPAHHNRVESPTRNGETNIRDLINSSNGHVCHSPLHASSPVYVSSSGASSTGDRCSVTRLAGEVDVHVSTIFHTHPSHLEAQDHPGGWSDSCTISPPWFPHLLHLCMDHPCFFPYCRDLLSQHGYV